MTLTEQPRPPNPLSVSQPHGKRADPLPCLPQGTAAWLPIQQPARYGRHLCLISFPLISPFCIFQEIHQRTLSLKKRKSKIYHVVGPFFLRILLHQGSCVSLSVLAAAVLPTPAAAETPQEVSISVFLFLRCISQ